MAKKLNWIWETGNLGSVAFIEFSNNLNTHNWDVTDEYECITKCLFINFGGDAEKYSECCFKSDIYLHLKALNMKIKRLA